MFLISLIKPLTSVIPQAASPRQGAAIWWSPSDSLSATFPFQDALPEIIKTVVCFEVL